jgi:hypothetical protein
MRRRKKQSRTSVANGKRLAVAGNTFHHSVYVILLGSRRTSPSIDPASEPESRPGEAMRYGLRLMPELYEYLNRDAVHSSNSNGVSLGISKQVSAPALRHPGAAHIQSQHLADTERLYGTTCRAPSLPHWQHSL